MITSFNEIASYDDFMKLDEVTRREIYSRMVSIYMITSLRMLKGLSDSLSKKVVDEEE